MQQCPMNEPQTGRTTHKFAVVLNKKIEPGGTERVRQVTAQRRVLPHVVPYLILSLTLGRA